jgi:hypothetical protein
VSGPCMLKPDHGQARLRRLAAAIIMAAALERVVLQWNHPRDRAVTDARSWGSIGRLQPGHRTTGSSLRWRTIRWGAPWVLG